MDTLTLIRTTQGDSGTFGKMGDWYTAELPWKNNVQSISCVPEGTYTCKWLFSPKHNAFKYHLVDVPGREVIEIHVGNFAGDVSLGYQSDVLGCILLGTDKGQAMTTHLTENKMQDAVLHSTPAIQAFETKMNQQDFTLVIRYL